MKKGIMILIVVIVVVLIGLLFFKSGDTGNKKIEVNPQKTADNAGLSENDLADQGYVKLDTDDEVFNAIDDTVGFLD